MIAGFLESNGGAILKFFFNKVWVKLSFGAGIDRLIPSLELQPPILEMGPTEHQLLSHSVFPQRRNVWSKAILTILQRRSDSLISVSFAYSWIHLLSSEAKVME
jgi:hypothetical protein